MHAAPTDKQGTMRQQAASVSNSSTSFGQQHIFWTATPLLDSNTCLCVKAVLQFKSTHLSVSAPTTASSLVHFLRQLQLSANDNCPLKHLLHLLDDQLLLFGLNHLYVKLIVLELNPLLALLEILLRVLQIVFLFSKSSLQSCGSTPLQRNAVVALPRQQFAAGGMMDGELEK